MKGVVGTGHCPGMIDDLLLAKATFRPLA